MASSKVMASSNSSNPDLTPQSCSIHSIPVSTSISGPTTISSFGSINMDDLIRSIYPTDNPTIHVIPQPISPRSNGSDARILSLPRHSVPPKSVDEVWSEISSGAGSGSGDAKIGGPSGSSVEPQPFEEMTLEDFLTKAGAVREEDVSVPVPAPASANPAAFQALDPLAQNSNHNQNNNNTSNSNNIFQHQVVVEGGGRGKRRAVEETVDRAALQRQRRMIKNRESAARSRERKQAYTVELESLVTQLEEENTLLVRQQMEQTKKRFKQLMENLIPVEEKRRPPRILRKTQSMSW